MKCFNLFFFFIVGCCFAAAIPREVFQQIAPVEIFARDNTADASTANPPNANGPDFNMSATIEIIKFITNKLKNTDSKKLMRSFGDFMKILETTFKLFMGNKDY